MASSADPNAVIQLPRGRPGDLGTLMLELASTGRAIIAELDHRAKAQKKKPDGEASALPDAVPPRVIEALGDMEGARPPLVEALRQSESPDGVTPEQRSLDVRLDAGWRCVRLTYELGEQRATLRGDVSAAAQCRDDAKRTLPDGLSFISTIGRDEYTLSDRHLGVLEGDLAARFRALPGGAALMTDLRATHDAYGKAFYITAAAPVAVAEAPGVGDAAAEAASATREYIAAVVGTVRRADPRTRALADRLLAPLANYGRAVAPPAPVADADPSGPRPPTPPVEPTG